MRVRCWLLGCACARSYPACHYCAADLYEGPFLQEGKLQPILVFWADVKCAVRKLGPKKCDQCGKKFVHGYDDHLCSEKCFNDWLPF